MSFEAIPVTAVTNTETAPISSLGAGTTPTAADLFIASQSDTDKQITGAQLLAFISPVQGFVVSGVDGLATGQTTIIPTQAGKRFYPVGSPLVELTALTGVGTVPTISIGNEAVTFANIVPATALTGLTTVNNLAAVALVTSITTLASIDINTLPIKVNVSIAALTYTVYTLRVLLFGYVL